MKIEGGRARREGRAWGIVNGNSRRQMKGAAEFVTPREPVAGGQSGSL